MKSTELLNLLSKQWANTEDIKKIASCGRDNATVIRDDIRSDILKTGKFLPKAKYIIVPMKSVIEYLDLNLDHISSMAEKEQSINS